MMDHQIDIYEYMEDIKLHKTVLMYGQEWYPMEVKPEEITEYDRLAVLGEYRYNNKDYKSICDAYYNGKEIIAVNVPWDIPRPKWKYWRLVEKVYPVEIKGLCDDAYCPKCGYCFWETKELDCEKCPVCKTRISWKPWHDRNDEEDLNG